MVERAAAMIDEWRCDEALDALFARGDAPPSVAQCRALLPPRILRETGTGAPD